MITRQNVLTSVSVVIGIGIICLRFIEPPLPLYIDDISALISACSTPTSLQWGPLYSLLYCGLVRASPDLITAFYIKQACVTLLTGIMTFVFARTNGLKIRTAIIMSLWVVIGPLANFNGTSEFAFVFLLAALSIAKLGGDRFGWLGFFIFMAAAFLVRAEFILGLGLGVVLLAARIIAERRTADRLLIANCISGILILAACTQLYVSSTSPEAPDRSWRAFTQHFALHYSRAYQPLGDPWTEPERYVQPFFPDSRSVGQALAENPRMFGWFVSQNMLVSLPASIIDIFTFSALQTNRSELGTIIAAAISICVLIAILFGLRARTCDWKSAQMLPFVSVLIIPVVSIATSSPEARHLLPLIPLIIVIVGRWLDQHQPAVSLSKHVPLLVQIAFGVGLCGTLCVFIYTNFVVRTPSIKDAVIDIRWQASQTQPVHVLELWGSERACILAQNPYCMPANFAGRAQSGEKLSQYIQRQQAHVIIADASWQVQTDVQSDPAMRDFLARPAAFNCPTDTMTQEELRLIECSPFFELPPQP